jgi:hypothetical protein
MINFFCPFVVFAVRATCTAYFFLNFEHVNDILWQEQTKHFFIM